MTRLTIEGPPPQPMDCLRVRDVAKLFKVQPRTIRKWVKDGEFPKPIVKPNMTFWFWRSIDRWLKEQGQ